LQALQLLLQVVGRPESNDLEKNAPGRIPAMEDREVREDQVASSSKRLRFANEVELGRQFPELERESLLELAVVSAGSRSSGKRIAIEGRLSAPRSTLGTEMEVIAGAKCGDQRSECPAVQGRALEERVGARDFDPLPSSFRARLNGAKQAAQQHLSHDRASVALDAE
jgi:hypothetical protein